MRLGGVWLGGVVRTVRHLRQQGRIGSLDGAELGALASMVNDGIVVTESVLEAPGPRIVYVNDAVVRATGFTREEMIGSSPRMFQGRRTDQLALERIDRALRAGESVREELINYRKDGSEFVIDLDITPVRGAGGAVSGFVAVQRDVTSLRAADRRFRALVEHSSDLISVNAPNGVVSYVSPSVRAVLGWDPDDLVGRYGAEFVHPDDLVAVANGLTAKSAAPGPYPTVQFRFRHANGSWRWLEAVTTNMLDDPAIEGMVVNARDITDRKLLDEQLHQAMKIEASGRVASGVAHEFNNLLTVINGYAELVLSDPHVADRPETHEHVASIAAAGQRAKSLTTQLLSFSRRHGFHPAVVDCNAVIVDTLGLLGRFLGDHIEVVVDLDPSECWVVIDADQFGQVIMNLALNGRDAMTDRGVLTVATRRELAAGGIGTAGAEVVVIEVTDTGVGVDAADFSRIFEAFFTTKAPGRGTGLGLSVVSTTITQAGGAVGLRSDPGCGSTFTITLPVAPAVENVGAVADRRALAADGRKILVVDDDRFVAELAARMLERLGWDAVAASAPLDGLDESEFDAVLCDISMPAISGPRLVAQLRARNPQLSVLYMSGYPMQRSDDDLLVGTTDRVLAKPFTLQQLGAAMEFALAER